MRAFAIAAGLFAVSAIANPIAKRTDDCDEEGNPCMTMEQAQKVADNFGELLSDYSDAAANAYLTRGFDDYADSVSWLVNQGCPNGPKTLGEVTFTNRAQFKAGQGSQPNIPYVQKNIWHTCDTVIVRWQSNDVDDVAPPAQELITGMLVMETKYVGGDEPYKIETLYSEFNTGAWAVDIGLFTPSCPNTKRDVFSLPGRMA